MISAPDRQLIQVCKSETRCLVTLDREFGNPLLYEPSNFAGIAVLRLPPKPTPNDLHSAVSLLASTLNTESIAGKLWTVQRDRIREYHPDPEP